MELRNLATFLQVAELNSFTKTAEKLGYSQSTVSFQIKQLETELATPLFERINHTIALTPQGRELLRYAQQVTRLTQQMQAALHREQAVRGHVRLALADSLCDSLLGAQFGKFRAQYPHITLQLLPAGTEEMFRLLNHNEADAILTLDAHIYNTDYVIVREEKVGVHFVAAASSPLCGKGPLTLDELLSNPFLLTERGMSYRRLMDEALAGRSREIKPVLEIGSTALLCALAEQGVGVSLLPDFVTERSVRAGRLARLEVPELTVEVWKQLLYHRGKWLSPQLESVLGYCAAREFAAQPAGPGQKNQPWIVE